MRIVIALDSFKGCLTAAAACEAVADGLHAVDPATDCILKPMADGGEGTAAALLAARPGGEWIELAVQGPLPGQSVNAGYAWFADDGTAVVEMASASGLPLLRVHERNPLHTTTVGTGQLLLAAARRGARRILLAIGGSATVDGGTGAATALGWRLLDAAGHPVLPAGGQLARIARIVPPPGGTNLPPVTVLCDVTNPLCGPDGAAAIFGPQKGATPAMVIALEAGLSNLAQRISTDLGLDVRALSGGGAAGGLGAGAAAFLGAQLAPGITTIMVAAGLGEALTGAHWCITGEGSFDSQSLKGKVVSGVAWAARAAGVPVAVFAGQVHALPAACRTYGIRDALALQRPGMTLETSMRRTPELLRDTAATWLRGIV